jgi:hypothetical protein
MSLEPNSPVLDLASNAVATLTAMDNALGLVSPKQSSSLTRIYHCQLAHPIKLAQLEQFRGAIAEQAGLDNELFHNHDNSRENYHYRYPVIQYYCDNGKAAMIGIGEGADALTAWAESYAGKLQMGGKFHQAPIEEYQSRVETIQTTDEWHTYRVSDWVALNEKNYLEWRNRDRLADQLVLLERAFVAHVMAFARGINWFVDRRLTASLTDYHGCQWHQRRGADMLAFDATFRIQAILPEGIGLGKGVSIGFGRVGRGE